MKPEGCIQFVKQRRQVYLDSMMHEVNTNGCSPSTTEMGFLRFLFKSDTEFCSEFHSSVNNFSHRCWLVFLPLASGMGAFYVHYFIIKTTALFCQFNTDVFQKQRRCFDLCTPLLFFFYFYSVKIQPLSRITQAFVKIFSSVRI